MDAREARRVPEPLTWEEAAATPLTFIVVYDMLIAQGRLSAGQWLLVTAVSSGVGVAALQTGKVLGARVIGTSGSAEKLARLEKLGLDVGIRTRAGDFHDAVMKATDGKGVSLVVNNVGGSVFGECVRSLAFEGRLAIVGHLDRVLSATLDIEVLHRKRRRAAGRPQIHGVGRAGRQDRRPRLSGLAAALTSDPATLARCARGRFCSRAGRQLWPELRPDAGRSHA